MEKTFMEAMDFRHACKVFDETKKITDEDMNYILEVGRKSPSSFGMEGWKFLVITNEELKAKIRPVCWNQVQVTSCSHLVIILAAIDAVKPSSGEVERKFKRREMPQDKLDFYLGLYISLKHKKDQIRSNKLSKSALKVIIYVGALMLFHSAELSVGVDLITKLLFSLIVLTESWSITSILIFLKPTNYFFTFSIINKNELLFISECKYQHNF